MQLHHTAVSSSIHVSIHLLDKIFVLNRKILRNKLCRLYIANIGTNYVKLSPVSTKHHKHNHLT